MEQQIKVGDVFVRDAGDGFTWYRVVTGAKEHGYHNGISFGVNPEGEMFCLSIEYAMTPRCADGHAKYGNPVPVETQQETQAAA
jgi:hypothetical protein